MALDSCHEQVVNALHKAGWDVYPKIFYIETEEMIVNPDIQARRQTNGSSSQIVVIEVKCFADEDADQDELYRAIGQYLIYRNVLQVKSISATLYLAIPDQAYQRLFIGAIVSATINESKINLIVVDVDREEIIQWFD
ncbi:MAG: hypothetical protein K8I30_14785 [Anaerolineae bacterium]|nr:hypothetical protein [Anaerolineae bacterium]